MSRQEADALPEIRRPPALCKAAIRAADYRIVPAASRKMSRTVSMIASLKAGRSSRSRTGWIQQNQRPGGES